MKNVRNSLYQSQNKILPFLQLWLAGDTQRSKNEHFHLESTPSANLLKGAKGSNRITSRALLNGYAMFYETFIEKK